MFLPHAIIPLSRGDKLNGLYTEGPSPGAYSGRVWWGGCTDLKMGREREEKYANENI